MATQVAPGKGKKGGKKGKKGGGSPDKKGGKGQGKTKGSDGPKDDKPPSLLEHHMSNKPKEDTASSRDEDIARFQNEAAVLEKNIREITSQIELDKRSRSSLKNKRQASYEAMNAARDVLQAKKADKDKVYQCIQQFRNSRNTLRGDRNSKGKGRKNFSTIAELESAIKKLETDMQCEVLTLKQEKEKMREIKELTKMRPEVRKISRQNEVLQQFTENTKEQHDEDQAAYTTLKKAVQECYEVQQGKYSLFQEAVEEDNNLNKDIEDKFGSRKEFYARQKEIRTLISDRKRSYQKSQRDGQRWDSQLRKLKRDVDFYNRQQQRAEADRQKQERLAQWKTQVDLDREEEAQQDTTRQEAQNKQRTKRRAERDDPSPSPNSKSGEPRPPRTTRAPRERQARKPRDAQVYQAPKQEPLERQKFQLKAVITYVKTLLPTSGESGSAEDMTGKFNCHKGGFKPSRDTDYFGQDMFANTRKSRKSKRKKKKKTKERFFVQSHTPPTVQQAFTSLKRWLAEEGCQATISLPMRPSEAEKCISNLAEAEKFIVDWDPAKRKQTQPKKQPKQEQPADAKPEEPAEEPTPTEEVPEQSEAQPDTEPEVKDEPTVVEAAPEDTAAQPESLPSEPAPDAAPQPPDTQGASADAAEPSDEAAEAEATPIADTISSQSQPEAATAADAQPQDGDADEAAPAVDTKPEQPDTTTPVHKDDAAPAQATNENQDDEDDGSDDESEEEEESSDDGVEVVESMVI